MFKCRKGLIMSNEKRIKEHRLADKQIRKLGLKEYLNYKETENLIEKHLSSSLKNLDYKNYKRLSDIIEWHENYKSRLVNGVIYPLLISAVVSILPIVKSGFYSILYIIPIIGVPFAISSFINLKEERLYNRLYKSIKKQGMLEDVKDCLKQYQLSEEFLRDKEKYELEESKNELNRHIDDYSYHIHCLEHNYNVRKGTDYHSTQQERIEIVDDNKKTYVEHLGQAMPLIAKMLQQNKNLKIISSNEPLKKECEKTNENGTNPEDNNEDNHII